MHVWHIVIPGITNVYRALRITPEIPFCAFCAAYATAVLHCDIVDIYRTAGGETCALKVCIDSYTALQGIKNSYMVRTWRRASEET